jgi:hypothetical protein
MIPNMFIILTELAIVTQIIPDIKPATAFFLSLKGGFSSSDSLH